MASDLLVAIEELLERKLEDVLERKLEEKLEQKLDEKLEEKLERKLDEKLEQKLDEKLGGLYERMDRMELILENEIRPNIMRVAEGHIDLKRKLDEALEISNEMEKLDLKVNYHDIEIRNLKAAWIAT